MNVHGQDLSLQFSRLLLLWFRRLLILLDVELPQKHNGLLSKDAASDRVRLVNAGAVGCEHVGYGPSRRVPVHLLGVDVQDAPSAAKALVPTAKVDTPNAVLAQHGGAHDARLDGDIEVGLVENLDWIFGQDTSDGNELGVPGPVERPVRLVHAATYDLAVLDENTADRCFIALQCKLGLFG